MTDIVLFLIFGAGIFATFGALAWLADRPTRTRYPDRWTD